MSSRKSSAKKTLKLQSSKVENDKQDKPTAEDSLSKSLENVIIKPKRDYVFKNKSKQIKKLQNDKLKRLKR